ncbi:hypothetical protein [Lysinibacillus sp. FSL P4-0201]|uniref:hypothetical protein n=1 Tax=Lysinibacillus sp. FSL P4-0201 TaxID=2921721 RepID=UPI00315B0008
MNNEILQINPVERVEVHAVLLDQSTKAEYKYLQTCYIESKTKRMYEENLKKINYRALLTEMQDKIENAFDAYLESEEGKSSKYSHINDRNKRILVDEQYSIISNTIKQEYKSKLDVLREKCKVNIKEEVFSYLSIEVGDIVYSIDSSQLTEEEVKNMLSSLAKEWSEELILTHVISSYEVETKILLSNGKVIENFYIGSTFR